MQLPVPIQVKTWLSFSAGGFVVVQRILEMALRWVRLAGRGVHQASLLNSRMTCLGRKRHRCGALSRASLELANQLEGAKQADWGHPGPYKSVVRVEAIIDYPEDDILRWKWTRWQGIQAGLAELERLLPRIKESAGGLKAVITGKPNVGNQLTQSPLDEQRALVTDIPGTTRDIIEVLNLKGIPTSLVLRGLGKRRCGGALRVGRRSALE